MINLNFHGLGKVVRPVPEGELHCWLEGDFFTKILDRVKGREDVRLSFDDANESDFLLALPLLKERGLKARFFAVADRIGQPHFLSADQLKSLCAEGMIVANHGMHHVPWKNLGKESLYEELVTARQQIESVTGIPIVEAACPFGSYGRKALRELASAGYERVYTSDGGPASVDDWLQSRNTVTRSDTLKTVEAMLNPRSDIFGSAIRECKKWVKRWR